MVQHTFIALNVNWLSWPNSIDVYLDFKKGLETMQPMHNRPKCFQTCISSQNNICIPGETGGIAVGG